MSSKIRTILILLTYFIINTADSKILYLKINTMLGYGSLSMSVNDPFVKANVEDYLKASYYYINHKRAQHVYQAQNLISNDKDDTKYTPLVDVVHGYSAFDQNISFGFSLSLEVKYNMIFWGGQIGLIYNNVEPKIATSLHRNEAILSNAENAQKNRKLSTQAADLTKQVVGTRTTGAVITEYKNKIQNGQLDNRSSVFYLGEDFANKLLIYAGGYVGMYLNQYCSISVGLALAYKPATLYARSALDVTSQPVFDTSAHFGLMPFAQLSIHPANWISFFVMFSFASFIDLQGALATPRTTVVTSKPKNSSNEQDKHNLEDLGNSKSDYQINDIYNKLNYALYVMAGVSFVIN